MWDFLTDLFGAGNAGGDVSGGNVPYYLASPEVVPNNSAAWDANMFGSMGVPDNYQLGDVAGGAGSTGTPEYLQANPGQPNTGQDNTTSQDFLNQNMFKSMGVPDNYQEGDVTKQFGVPETDQAATQDNVIQDTPQSPLMGLTDTLLNKAKGALGSGIKLATDNPKMALGLGGTLANLAGNVINNKAQNTGQQNYLNAVSWTPDKVNNYMNALKSNVTSLYGNQAQGANKAMSASNASRGKGGGSYGQRSEDIGREMRSNIASAINQGALTTNQPQNLNYNAFTEKDALGDTLTGVGGIFGKLLGTESDLELLRRLGISK